MRKSVVGKWCFWTSESPLFVSNVCVCFFPSCIDGSADRRTETTTEATCLQVTSVCPPSGTARAVSSRCVSLWAVRNILTNRAALSTLQVETVPHCLYLKFLRKKLQSASHSSDHEKSGYCQNFLHFLRKKFWLTKKWRKFHIIFWKIHCFNQAMCFFCVCFWHSQLQVILPHPANREQAITFLFHRHLFIRGISLRLKSTLWENPPLISLFRLTLRATEWHSNSGTDEMW